MVVHAAQLLREGHCYQSAVFDSWVISVSGWLALCRILGLLRQIEVIAPLISISPKPLEQIVQDFERYLLRERGLSRTTAIRHLPPLRKFLQEYCSEGTASFSRLSAADIVRLSPPAHMTRVPERRDQCAGRYAHLPAISCTGDILLTISPSLFPACEPGDSAH